MFDESLIVSTAISSFNNSALYGPYFFVTGLFCVPLLVFVYMYGRDFANRIGWKNTDVEGCVGFWTVACLVLWLLMFGGNYAVIRDSISWLPVGLAAVLFGLFMFLANRAKKLGYINKIQNKKLKWLLVLLILALVVLVAMPTWWGILLQLIAVLVGGFVGYKLRKNIPDILTTEILIGLMTVLILMQPEYFRFGQLGNLTLIHILALMVCGFFWISALVTKYTNARSKIYNGAYIKLKWLFRIVALLAFILFVLTESVPVFVGLVACCGILGMLTVYHGKQKQDVLSKQSWAMLLVTFGIIIMCPLISALGVFYLLFLPTKIDFKDFLRLL
jgi:hypothetical protein